MAISYLSIVSHVRSFYVENTRDRSLLAGPFHSDGLARNALISLDGERYKVREYDSVPGAWEDCDVRYGVFDTHEDRFLTLARDTSRIYVTSDGAEAAYRAKTLNTHQRNETRLQQYRERHPVAGDYI
jgi:hypothetical protein